MVLGDSAVKKSRAFAGLPSIDEKDKKMYIQLAGRILLIFLFVGFVFAGEWGLGRVIVSLFGLVACVMVVVGFKAKLSAILLVVLLSVFNILVNNFWTVSTHDRYLQVAHTDIACSCILTTLTKTLRNTTSSRSSPLLVDCCCWSIWVRVPSALTRRKRCTRGRRLHRYRHHDHNHENGSRLDTSMSLITKLTTEMSYTRSRCAMNAPAPKPELKRSSGGSAACCDLRPIAIQDGR